MPQFLVAGYLPGDFDPSQMDEAAGLKIHAFNKEMEAAGVLKMACGLGAAKALRAQKDGKVRRQRARVVISARVDWAVPRLGCPPIALLVKYWKGSDLKPV